MGFAELKGKSLSAPALELYWNAMQGWSLEDFQAAANQLIRTCEWMPTPKNFEDLRKAGRMTAAEAWDRALRHCSTGAWRKGPLGDELIDQAIRVLGGYQAIAMGDISALQWLEKRFCQHYEQVEDAHDTRESVPQIAYDSREVHPRVIAGLKWFGAT